MKRVLKYTLTPCNKHVKMPENAELLSTDFQGDELRIWAMVDTDMKETELRSFEVFMTGGIIPNPVGFTRKFIDTVLTGDLVYHVFENIGYHEQ